MTNNLQTSRRRTGLVLAASVTLAMATPIAALTAFASEARVPLDHAILGDNLSQSQVAGSWATNFGTMTLPRPGSTATGSFVDNARRVNGSITNVKLSGTTLSANWKSTNGAPRGVTWTLSGDTIMGGSTVDPYKAWCGAKQGRPFPPNCAFAGQWTIELNGSGTGTMNLVQTGTSVSGSYSTKLTSGKVSGVISYVNGLPVLTGQWSTSRGSGSFKLYLVNNSARQFQGNADGRSGWCGWRTGEKKPSACLK